MTQWLCYNKWTHLIIAEDKVSSRCRRMQLLHIILLRIFPTEGTQLLPITHPWFNLQHGKCMHLNAIVHTIINTYHSYLNAIVHTIINSYNSYLNAIVHTINTYYSYLNAIVHTINTYHSYFNAICRYTFAKRWNWGFDNENHIVSENLFKSTKLHPKSPILKYFPFIIHGPYIHSPQQLKTANLRGQTGPCSIDVQNFPECSRIEIFCGRLESHDVRCD